MFLPRGSCWEHDSTATFVVPNPANSNEPALLQHFDSAQKLFEIGDGSTAGIVFWGLGGFPNLSYRSIIADVELTTNKAHFKTLRQVVDLFSRRFWLEYQRAFGPLITTVSNLPDSAANKKIKTKVWTNLSGGFCIGGRWGDEHVAESWIVEYDPFVATPLVPSQLSIGQYRLWGWKSLVERVIHGVDNDFLGRILASSHWSGTRDDLLALVRSWAPGSLPIREAIDWVHSMIYTAIKAMKFSPFPNFCGGPIEVAVITTDRNFRWIRHKRLDEALGQDPKEGGAVHDQWKRR